MLNHFDILAAKPAIFTITHVNLDPLAHRVIDDIDVSALVEDEEIRPRSAGRAFDNSRRRHYHCPRTMLDVRTLLEGCHIRKDTEKKGNNSDCETHFLSCNTGHEEVDT